MGLLGPASGCPRTAFFLGPRGGGESVPSSFPSSRAACSPGPPPPPSCRTVTLTPASVLAAPSRTLLSPSFTHKDPCDDLGPVWVVPGHLPPQKSPAQSHPPSPCAPHGPRVPGSGIRTRSLVAGVVTLPPTASEGHVPLSDGAGRGQHSGLHSGVPGAEAGPWAAQLEPVGPLAPVWRAPGPERHQTSPSAPALLSQGRTPWGRVWGRIEPSCLQGPGPGRGAHPASHAGVFLPLQPTVGEAPEIMVSK